MKKTLLLFLGILSLSVLASGAPLVIDHFAYDELNPNLIVTTATPVLSSTQTDASILGGQRFVQATHVTGSGAVSLVRPLGAPFHYITCNTESGNDGAWEFAWGSTYAGGALLGDLTNGGFADTIIIEFLAADAAVGVNMTVLPLMGVAETVVSSTPIGPGLVLFAFSDYSFSFTSIDSLRFSFTSVDASDFAVDSIVTNNLTEIPEPASLLISGLLLGLGLLRRRR
jgi:hypothetical protein